MKKPIVAICYDFDKTLTPNDMQAQGFIQSIGLNVNDFWAECRQISIKHNMDSNLSYMYLMVDKACGQILLTKKTLIDYGSKITLYNGLNQWFNRINAYGDLSGVLVEHYIISSGLKEMIEGCTIANEFTEIYASSFMYNDKGIPVWPAQAVNYTNKTQYLFRISKGVCDVTDDTVNDLVSPDKIRIPFKNMVYIGDSVTDIPCMKLVNSYNGYSIGVYDSEGDRSLVDKMTKDGRIRYSAPCDYTKDSVLDKIIHSIIDKTIAEYALEQYSVNK